VDGESPDRYGQIWEAARGVLSAAGPTPSADAAGPEPRFYGGFAFRDDQPASGVWKHFPSGLFVLPEVELEFSGGSPVLRGRRFVEEWEDAAGVGDLLTRRLETLAAAIGGSPHAPSHAPSAEGQRRLEAAPPPDARRLWDSVVNDALTAIATERVSKVVLARTLDVMPKRVPDAVDVLMALWADNPRAHVFLFEPVPGSTLLGAAPETVATVYGSSFHATAVAGSVPHGSSPEETAALAEQLLSSRKDQLEHRFAVEDMVERLEAIAIDVGAEWEPHVITLSRIQHLETRIRARLTEGCTVLMALRALHPTPAVCGLPRDEALAFIQEEEPFDRGWYAGPVGWFDAGGSGVFAPALRCAVGEGGSWRLFAGAGIVAGSRPDLEWDETGIKFEPVLRALAVSAGA
jgi:menaquinone-specific isochorismate synthase